eukprot:scaffold99332_cov33-Phaeocystis_antarctica.AAC.1
MPSISLVSVMHAASRDLGHRQPGVWQACGRACGAEHAPAAPGPPAIGARWRSGSGSGSA